LNLAEAGEFEKAAMLFHNRFFPREEGGTNVRQVWLEVQIQRALSMARKGECSDATNTVDDLSQPVPDLAFTSDGLESFLQSARFTYLIGNVYKSCKVPDKALSMFKQAAGKSDPSNFRILIMTPQSKNCRALSIASRSPIVATPPVAGGLTMSACSMPVWEILKRQRRSFAKRSYLRTH
jgi:hypothetical protein